MDILFIQSKRIYRYIFFHFARIRCCWGELRLPFFPLFGLISASQRKYILCRIFLCVPSTIREASCETRTGSIINFEQARVFFSVAANWLTNCESSLTRLRIWYLIPVMKPLSCFGKGKTRQYLEQAKINSKNNIIETNILFPGWLTDLRT